MSLRKRHERRRNPEAEEINLIPVMNLFVCLIPFLLLTAAFVRFGAIDTELPTAAPANKITAELEQNKSIELIFQMQGEEVIVTGFRNTFSTPIENVNKRFLSSDDKAISAYIDELKEKYSKLSASIFKAGDQTRFEDAIRVLGTLRKHQALESLVLATEVVN